MRARATCFSTSALCGRNSCSGGVEQADRHRPALHDVEQPLEVALLQRGERAERGLAALVGVREDRVDHLLVAVLAEEHVLRAAQADALGAELPRLGGVLGRVGVGAHAEAAQVVGPARTRWKCSETSGR
jgi:hypothetical protein